MAFVVLKSGSATFGINTESVTSIMADVGNSKVSIIHLTDGSKVRLEVGVEELCARFNIAIAAVAAAPPTR